MYISEQDKDLLFTLGMIGIVVCAVAVFFYLHHLEIEEENKFERSICDSLDMGEEVHRIPPRCVNNTHTIKLEVDHEEQRYRVSEIIEWAKVD